MAKALIVKIFSLIIVCAGLYTVSAQSIEALSNSGQDALRMGAYSQAVTAFRQVLSREADNFEAQFNLAFAYLQWGRQGNAVEEFKKALKLQPRNSQVWSNLAIAYENQGKSQDAIDALYQAVNLDPNNITARMNLAVMYANADRNPQAITQFKRVIELDGTNVDALINLSKCLITAGQTNEAKLYLNQVVANNPNSGEAYWELGNIHWKKENDLDKAISSYKLAVTVEPNGAQFYENLALALESKGNKDEAVEVLKKSLVYTVDALRKEQIQAKINMMERGAQGTGATGSEKAASQTQLRDLRAEFKQDEAPTETRRMETKPIDVMSDFEGLNASEEPALDLKKETMKRMGKE